MPTDFNFQFQDTQGFDRVRAAEEIARAKRPSALAIFMASQEQASLTANAIERLGGPQFTPDPSFRLSPERVDQLSKQYGVGTEYLGDLIHSTSDAQAENTVQRAKQELDNKALLANAGWTGVAAQMFAGVTDPATLALSFTPAGIAGWAERGGALRAAIKSGLVAGSSNAAIEAALAGMHTTSDPNDVLSAGLMGFALGAPLGGLLGHTTQRAANLAKADLLERMKAQGALTPAGEAHLATAADGATNGVPPVAADAGVMSHADSGVPVAAAPEVPAGVVPAAPVEAPVARPARSFEDLMAFAQERKIPVEEGRAQAAPLTEGGLTADVVQLPHRMLDTEFMAQHGADKATVLAHELGHHLAAQWNMAGEFAGPQYKALRAEMRRLSKEYRPAVWESAPSHAGKTSELFADSIATLLRNPDVEAPELRAFLGEGRLAELGVSPVEEAAPAFQGGSIGAGQVADVPRPKSRFISARIPFTKIEVPLRFDPYAMFERAGEHWSGFMSKLIDDPVAKEGFRGADGQMHYAAHEINAHEWAMLETKRYETAADAALHDSFTAFKKRNGLNWLEGQRSERAFYEDVTAALRGDAEAIARNPEAAQAAQHIARQNEDILTRMKALMVEGADAIDPNAHYVMRKFNFDNIRLLSADPEYRNAMHQLVTEAIRKAQPQMDAERAAMIGKNFLKRVRDIPTDRKNLGFLSDAGRDRLAVALRKGGTLDDAEIEDILSFVYGATKRNDDAKAAPRMKHRLFLDENHKVSFTTKDGVERTLSFKDLLVNDIRMLNRDYVRQTTGLMGLAKVGYRSKQDITDALDNAVRMDKDTTPATDNKINSRRDAAERIIRGITGQPMFEGFGSKTEKLMRTAKNVSFMQYMAQGLMAQVAELGQPLAMKTIMAMRQTMPEFEHVLNQVASGAADKNLLRDLKAMGSVASEADLRRPIPGLMQGDSIDHVLTKVDNAASKGAYAISRASGMAAINDFERSQVAKLYTQRLLNLAAGFEKTDTSMLKRLATNGVEADEWEGVAAAIRKHMEVDGRDVVGIDYEAWERESPRTYDLVRLAIHRETHRTIQEVSLGATPIWMHSSTGKLLGQFRSFVLNAYTKQLLNGIAHFDLQTFMSWSFTTMFGALAYTAQTVINYGHDSVEMDKRLAGDEIAKAAFNRAGFSSIIPMVYDSTFGFLTGQKQFSNARSTALGSDFFNGIPVIATLNKVWGAGSAAAQDVFTSDHVWTKREMGQLLGLLPNYYGIRSAVSQFKEDFPAVNYLRAGQQ